MHTPIFEYAFFVKKYPRNDKLRFSLVLITLLTVTSCASLNPEASVEPSGNAAAQLNLKLGIGYMQANRIDIAIDKLKKALQYDSSLVEAENALGVLYEATKANHLAELHYQNALQLKPDYLLAKMNYARFLCANNQTAKGEALFLEAAISPLQDAPEIAYTGAGVCARRANQIDQAEQYFRQALQVNAFASSALYELAVIKKDQQRYQEARDFLDSYHKRAGFSRTSLQLAIEIEQALGNNEMSEQYASMLRQQTSAATATQ
ncbi:MAG: type IV pilus biogenesis/stability protein PilW [Candidatus Competibacteraceae bacterium]|nr:type IV pilus biogenesis/stability protein PilW [Candidatus Competibacteraceae bacterium]